MTDTSPQVTELVRSRLLKLSGSERFLMGGRMFEAARTMVLASLAKDLSPAERKRQLYQRFYGEPLPTAEAADAR